MGDIKKPGDVSNETYNQILKETGGKAVIVIVLPTPLIADLMLMPEIRKEVKKFHIGVVNVEMRFLLPVLHFVTERITVKKETND